MDLVPRDLVAAAARRWLRYAAPLTALSATAFAPVIVLALRTQVAIDRAGVTTTIARGWGLVALGWLCQLVLVGGATPIARAAPAELSQLRAFTAGLAQLGRAIVPCVAAGVVIAIGCLALVVPGLVLFALLAVTGASDQRGLPAPLVDSIEFARRHLPAIAVAAGAMFVLDVTIGVAAQLVFASPAKLTVPALAAVPSFTRAIAGALVLVSPLPAMALAMVRARGLAPAPGFDVASPP